jgi:hypothetical protein
MGITTSDGIERSKKYTTPEEGNKLVIDQVRDCK